MGSAFVLMQSIAPGANASRTAPWHILVLPTAHFWFLQALFVVFLCTAALERLGLLGSWRRALLLAGASSAVSLVSHLPPWFSIDSAVYLMQYFLLGVATRLMPPPPRALRFGLAVAFFVLMLAVLTSGEPFRHRQSLVALATGGLGTWLLIVSPWQQRVLARLGNYSYPVFLFHVFFTAASRIVLQRLGVHEVGVLVAAGLAAGVLGPIAVALLIGRVRWAATLLLGAKPPKRPGSDAPKAVGVGKVYRVEPAKDASMLASMSVGHDPVPRKLP